MNRPEASVLPDSALVPQRNSVSPPPDQFSHVLSRPAPFWYDGAGSRPADGELATGTRVLAVRRADGDHCWVIDERGLYVQVEASALAAS